MGNCERINKKVQNEHEKNKVRRENLAKFFYDIAKLVFGAMVLVGGVSVITNDSDPSYIVLLILGLFFTTLLALVGNNVLKY